LKRILFVDDESKVLDGLRRMLHAERKRWDLQFATSGEDALKACEESAFDVVVSDMRMPGMDGATLLGHIRDRFPSTTRIILSGHSELGSCTRAIPSAHRFLNKPCDPADLRATLERVCTLQEVLGGPELRKIVGQVSELPSVSSTYFSLTQAVQEPNFQIATVVEIIEKDLAMSARVLQLSNSAFFGLARRTTNLRDAVTYLGVDTIKNLALTTEVFRAFEPNSKVSASVWEAMQQHGIRTASIAVRLATNKQSRDIAGVAALLHDLGKLILAYKMPDAFCSSIALAQQNNCRSFEAEEKLLGISHAEIGACFLGFWGLPDLIIEAIAHHHHPLRIPHSDFDVSIVLYIADILTHELTDAPVSPGSPDLSETDRANLETLGLLHRLPEFRKLALDGGDG
jgi:putative nucleotidyltransferase with HDIG domain